MHELIRPLSAGSDVTDGARGTLLVGFDSAWTATNSGAISGLVHRADGTFLELGAPRSVDYPQAEQLILEWQARVTPAVTIVMLDQPTIVTNAEGQRPVENIVASPVSLRYGGVQPANTSRTEMFGANAPVWPFLRTLGGAASPLNPTGNTWVLETYPVLALIALEWTLPDDRVTGRLPKYNPKPRKKFIATDWQHVCACASAMFKDRGLSETADWLASVALKSPPRKSEQDAVDACICLLVAILFSEGKDCLMVGEMSTGYMVVPGNIGLYSELEQRCLDTGRVPTEWVRLFRKPQAGVA